VLVFQRYEEADGVDNWAAKGVAVVRLRLPWGKIANVAWTHTQAGGSPETRADQVRQIYETLGAAVAPSGSANFFDWTNEEWLFLMGDLNIAGSHIVEEGAFPAVGQSVYPTFTNLDAPSSGLGLCRRPRDACEPAEFWERIGKPPMDSNFALYDAWAETTSEHDLGRTNHEGTAAGARIDYIFASRLSGASHWTRLPDLCVQHVWTPVEFRGLSDHLALAAEIGHDGPRCNPRLARSLTGEEMRGGAYESQPGRQALQVDGRIRHKGAAEWYYVEAPGTYAIVASASATGAQMDWTLYHDDDLSNPVTAGHIRDPTTIQVCSTTPAVEPPTGVAPGAPRGSLPSSGCRSVTATRTTLSGGTFLKVQAPDASFIGDYRLGVYRSLCEGPDDACDLLPNTQPQEVPVARLGRTAADAWYRVLLEERPDFHPEDFDSPREQHVQVFAQRDPGNDAPPMPALFKLLPTAERGEGASAIDPTKLDAFAGSAIREGAGSHGATLSPESRLDFWTGTTPEDEWGDGAGLVFTVPAAGVGETTTVGWRTDLLLLGGQEIGGTPALLTCIDETTGWTADEASAFLLADGLWIELGDHKLFDESRIGQDVFECDGGQHDSRSIDRTLGLRRVATTKISAVFVEDTARSEPVPVHADERPPHDRPIPGFEDVIETPFRAAAQQIWAGGEYKVGFWVAKHR
jgi:endonuclease/exonuclease/phosphatase family metal-dependent hydrolase